MISNQIEYQHYNDEEDEQGYGELAYKLCNKVGIRPSSRNELSYIATDKSKVVGALFSVIDQSRNEFSFDVVVDPNYQNQKIGSTLIDIIMKDFKSESHEFEHPSVWIHAVNPILVSYLVKKYGFTHEKDKFNRDILTYSF